MAKKARSEEQILRAQRQAESGTNRRYLPRARDQRSHFYVWKKYDGL